MSLPQRLLRVVPVLVAAAVMCWSATLNNDDDCRTIGECLGTGFDDLLVLALAVPLTAIAFRLLRVPRVVLHTVASLLVGSALWFGADNLLHALDPDRPYDALLPFPIALVVGVLTGVATTYLVGPGGRGWARLAIPAVVLVVAVATSAASAQAAHADRVEEIAAVPVTFYAPVVAGHGPSYGSGSTDSVRLSYSFELGADHVFIDVTLIPAPGGSLCGVDGVLTGPDCVQQGEVMRDLGPSGYGSVGLVRGDTALVADFDTDDLDPDDVLDALRDAPVAEPADLA